MTKLLVTGATGNVGTAVITSLSAMEGDFEILAGVRNLEASEEVLQLPKVRKVQFDFDDQKSVAAAIEQADVLFLLRPPQLADVEKYFQPIINTAKEQGIKHIIFLSVQGAEKSSWVPHHKIEKRILESGVNYTFLRPAYFMQNFTTTLKHDLTELDLIYLPSKNAKFTLVDVADIGKVSAAIFIHPEKHLNKAYELTSDDLLSFPEMTKILCEELGRIIMFVSPSLLSFFLRKRDEKVPPMKIFVMIMLHYLPRFKSSPQRTQCIAEITGTPPTSFRAFVQAHEKELRPWYQ